jgi:hypothetical protein
MLFLAYIWLLVRGWLVVECSSLKLIDLEFLIWANFVRRNWVSIDGVIAANYPIFHA